MNMFLHELKSYRKSTIIWTCSICAIVVVFLFMFTSLANEAAEMKKILAGYPEGVRKALGISLDTIVTLLGFYSFMFIYVVLCGAIQAMNLGTSIISKEVREKTADFLLTKPVSRKQVLTAKLLAALTSLGITNVIFLIVANIMASIVHSEPYSLKILLLISFTMFFIQLIFMSLGILISVIVPKIKSVIAVSLSTVFSFFILSMFGSFIGEEAIRYITPFKFFDSAYILKHAAYELPFVVLTIVLIIVAIGASYVIYDKRDIHAV